MVVPPHQGVVCRHEVPLAFTAFMVRENRMKIVIPGVTQAVHLVYSNYCFCPRDSITELPLSSRVSQDGC